MGLWITSINGYAPPDPDRDNIEVTPEPLVNAKRNSKGNLIGELRAWKYTIKAKYARMDGDTFHDLSVATHTDSSTTYFNNYVRFWSPQEQAYKTGYFYAPPIKYKAEGLPPDTEYLDVELELIEQ